MLSRNVKRALLDTRWALPPTFLLPWAASLTTVSHTVEASDMPQGPPPSISSIKAAQHTSRPSPAKAQSPPPPTLPPPPEPIPTKSSPPSLSPALREMLPLLKAQTPQYITAHIHGKPYLLTQGDTIRLPFLMQGVSPGDVLRLNRAINIGSRDYTFKARAAPAPRPTGAGINGRSVLDATTGSLASHSHVMLATETASPAGAPHFIPHIEKGKHGYLDDRLFVCRAVVMGVESEPLRIKEKTKRRQRRVKKVKSKHRFTVLRVKEVLVRDVEEVEGEEVLE